MENFNGKRKKSSQSHLKSSTTNILLNVSIFILFAVIIYMVYSLYIKLTFNSKETFVLSSNQSASDIIQVEVLNGCGISGVADRMTDYLRSKDFDVVNIGNYISYDVDESMVIDRIGNMANAYKVAKSLGIKNENVIQQLNKDYFLDVSIVIGRDYFSLTPFK